MLSQNPVILSPNALEKTQLEYIEKEKDPELAKAYASLVLVQGTVMLEIGREG